MTFLLTKTIKKGKKKQQAELSTTYTLLKLKRISFE
jgi:hypothetical protein